MEIANSSFTSTINQSLFYNHDINKAFINEEFGGNFFLFYYY